MPKSKLLASTAEPYVLNLFEKEKGGVGSSGCLVTAAHLVLMEGRQVTFIEASDSQNDIYNAYGHHRVHRIGLKTSDARDKIIDAVASSPPGCSIFVNIPGGKAQEIDEIHELVHSVLEDELLPLECVITWTMGLDSASRSTLDKLLQTSPPGRILLNLPAWHGEIEDFRNVDNELIELIEAMGGTTFQMPKLNVHLYDLFRVNEVAIDRIRDTPGVSWGNKAYLSLWEKNVRAVLTGIY